MNSKRTCATVAMAAGLLVLAGAGCQQPLSVRRPPAGASAFRFVERPVPAAAASMQMAPAEFEPVDVKVPAEPVQPLAKPVYPRAVLGRVQLPVTVGVRITVDAGGRVTHVGPSLVALSTGSEYSDDFRLAVERALAQWHFIPAELRHLVPKKGGPGQAGFWVVTRAEKTEDAFDVSFTFTATGEVVPEGVLASR